MAIDNTEINTKYFVSCNERNWIYYIFIKTQQKSVYSAERELLLKHVCIETIQYFLKTRGIPFILVMTQLIQACGCVFCF